jgi:hypothetical protein
MLLLNVELLQCIVQAIHSPTAFLVQQFVKRSLCQLKLL